MVAVGQGPPTVRRRAIVIIQAVVGVALASAAGLIAFEVVQLLVIGFQGLQLLIGASGVVLFWLSLGLP